MSRHLEYMPRQPVETDPNRNLVCPECGLDARESEVSHWLELPKYPAFPLGPTGDPIPAAATYTCPKGHKWTRDIKRKRGGRPPLTPERSVPRKRHA